MILKKQRIRSIGQNLGFLKEGQTFIVGLRNLGEVQEKLRAAGFGETISVGDTILPAAEFGPISIYNANGKEIIHKDREKETAYRQTEWRWTEWHGRNNPVEQSRIVDVPYERYPRTHVDPVGLELTVLSDTSGNMVITTPSLEYVPANADAILHTVNLLLEIFGECYFFTEDLSEIIKAPLKKLNWQVLPPGERPWQQLQKELRPIIDAAPEGKRVVIENRLEVINEHKPDFAAVGHGGFHGYVILGFPKKDLYVLESLLYGNATYLLGSEWEALSRLSKGEILQNNLEKGRVIHREGWDTNIRRWFRV